MIRVERCVDGLALVLAAASAFALAGCGSSDGGGQGTATGGGYGAGGQIPGAGGQAPAAGGQAPAAGGQVQGAGGQVQGAGGQTPAAGGTPQGAGGLPPAAGGTTPGAGGTTPGAGGTPTGAGGTPTGTDTGNLDPQGNLIVPAAADGFQIKTDKFTVNPSQEKFMCWHAQIPPGAELDVKRFESVMSKGSHHFIFYRADGDTTPANTLSNGGCTGGFGQQWIYTSGSPHSWLDMPKDVAITMNAGQRVTFDMHYNNTSDEPIDAIVALNMYFAKGTFTKAAALVSFNTTIFIPVNGKQTVSGDCTPGAGAKFFLMSTHTHRRGVGAQITRKTAAGALTDVLVKTTDWEHPGVGQWLDTPFVFGAGEKLHYSCDFVNDRQAITSVGQSAEDNEMCMAVTYYYPDTARGSCN
jgi:hypothetical protein